MEEQPWQASTRRRLGARPPDTVRMRLRDADDSFKVSFELSRELGARTPRCVPSRTIPARS